MRETRMKWLRAAVIFLGIACFAGLAMADAVFVSTQTKDNPPDYSETSATIRLNTDVDVRFNAQRYQWDVWLIDADGVTKLLWAGEVDTKAVECTWTEFLTEFAKHGGISNVKLRIAQTLEEIAAVKLAP